jgi:hypothetical protein
MSFAIKLIIVAMGAFSLFPFSASAQRTLRGGFAPFTLACSISGELGEQLWTLQIQDVNLKLLFLPTITSDGRQLDVDTFDDTRIKGNLHLETKIQGDPKDQVTDVNFDIDRITGHVDVQYQGPKQILPDKSFWRYVRKAAGYCKKIPRAL